MNEADYQMLCIAIEQQRDEALLALEREFEEKRYAARSLWEASRQNPCRIPWVQKEHGNLIEAVRQAALRLRVDFTLSDVEAVLREEQPLLLALSSRKSISTALRRLYWGRHLVLIEEGRSSKPARYSVAPLVPLNDQGKEPLVGTVSGRRA